MSSAAPPQPQSESPPMADERRRETLQSRARRIIGKTLEQPSKAIKKEPREGGIAHRRGPPKRSPSRRREQVLKAQRAHRERTQNYLTMLEVEVVQLREGKNKHQKRLQEMQDRVNLLENVLRMNNIAIPSGACVEDSPSLLYGYDASRPSPLTHGSSSTAGDFSDARSSTPGQDYKSSSASWSQGRSPPELTQVSVTRDGTVNINYRQPQQSQSQQVMLTVNWTDLAFCPSHHISNYNTELVQPREFEEPTDGSLQRWQGPVTPLPELGAQESVDFILELERLCFPHTKHNVEERGGRWPKDGCPVSHDTVGLAHLHSPTARIMQDMAPRDVTSEPLHFTQGYIAELFRLNLYSNEGEDATPAQIWANLVRISASGWQIPLDILQYLTKTLASYVYCNGFGAVVKKQYVSQLFAHWFPGEQFVNSWDSKESDFFQVHQI